MHKAASEYTTAAIAICWRVESAGAPPSGGVVGGWYGFGDLGVLLFMAQQYRSYLTGISAFT